MRLDGTDVGSDSPDAPKAALVGDQTVVIAFVDSGACVTESMRLGATTGFAERFELRAGRDSEG